MSRVVFVVLLLAGLVFWWHWQNTADSAARRRLVQKTVLWAVLAACVVLVATGRLSWLGAVAAAGLALLRQALSLAVRWFPVISRGFAGRGTTDHPGAIPGDEGPARRAPEAMPVAEALQVLGLEGTPSAEEITRAYRRVMQQWHPDRGGNAYFTAKANQARDVLIARFGRESGVA